MRAADLPRRLTAEALGTGLLVATVVGSGIMAQQLTQDAALQLLCNALPTGAMLIVLITIFAPLSGAHFNPAVSLAMAARGLLARSDVVSYIAAQCLGAIAGTLIAHAMFGQPLVSAFARPRTGLSLWLAEMIASFGLVAVIFGGLRARVDSVAMLVGLYITAAYWFTASTSYANPAVTLGRAFTSSFAGIRVIDVPGFVIAQLVGAGLAAALAGWLFGSVRKA